MKIKFLKNSALLIVLIISFACKKEKIEPPFNEYSETPVFSVSGNIGGTEMLFQAGVDDAYLENFNTMVNGVNRFGGKIIQGDNYVEIALFDGNLSMPNSSLPINSETITLSQAFSTPLLGLQKSDYSNESSIYSVQFSVNGVNVGSTLGIYEPGIYEVCTQVTFIGGATKNTCNEVIIGYQDFGAFTINAMLTGNNLTTANILNTLPVNSVDWYVDGDFQTSNSLFEQELSPGLHELSAHVHFTNGITRIHNVVVHGDNAQLYLQDINLFKTPISDALNQDFKGEISIFKGGILYKHIGGSGNSNILVTSYSYYGKSPSGVAIYKIAGIVNAQMKNMSTNEILPAQFNVVFGLEIP